MYEFSFRTEIPLSSQLNNHKFPSALHIYNMTNVSSTVNGENRVKLQNTLSYVFINKHTFFHIIPGETARLFSVRLGQQLGHHIHDSKSRILPIMDPENLQCTQYDKHCMRRMCTHRIRVTHESLFFCVKDDPSGPDDPLTTVQTQRLFEPAQTFK